jgi:hypothetical protein
MPDQYGMRHLGGRRRIELLDRNSSSRGSGGSSRLRESNIIRVRQYDNLYTGHLDTPVCDVCQVQYYMGSGVGNQAANAANVAPAINRRCP